MVKAVHKDKRRGNRHSKKTCQLDGCYEEFSSEWSLRRHQARRHKTYVTESDEEKYQEKVNESVSCPNCRKKISRKSLARH